MVTVPGWLKRLVHAHDTHGWRGQERHRALVRVGLCVLVLALAVGIRVGLGIDPSPLLRDPAMWVVAGYAALAAVYAWRLTARPGSGEVGLYGFLLADPALLALGPPYMPERAAWVSVLLVAVIAMNGLRYGAGALAVSWASAVVASLVGWLAIVDLATWSSHGVVLAQVWVGLLVVVPMFLGPIRWHAQSRAASEGSLTAKLGEVEVERRMRFLAMVVHDLRNPLQAILASVERMEQQDCDGVMAREVARLGVNASALGGMLTDVLTVGKEELGDYRMSVLRVSLRDSLELAAESAQPVANLRGLDLRVCLPADDLVVMMDRARLLQALGNLIGNACKYTPRGGFVQIELAAVADDSQDFSIRVSDSGPGLGESSLSGLYQAFERGTAASGPVPGFGLGLTGVKLFVDRLGGSLRAEPSDEGGARFVLTLPLVRPERADPPNAVLIVSDDAPASDEILRGLAATGRHLQAVRTLGRAELELAACLPVALVYDVRRTAPGKRLRIQHALRRWRSTHPGLAIHLLASAAGGWLEGDSVEGIEVHVGKSALASLRKVLPG